MYYRRKRFLREREREGIVIECTMRAVQASPGQLARCTFRMKTLPYDGKFLLEIRFTDTCVSNVMKFPNSISCLLHIII